MLGYLPYLRFISVYQSIQFLLENGVVSPVTICGSQLSSAYINNRVNFLKRLSNRLFQLNQHLNKVYRR